MKKNKVIIISISVVAILLVLITFFVISIRRDKLETKKVMNTIVKKYDGFEKKVLKFNEVRDEVYTTIFSDTYYDAIGSSYSDNNNKIKKLEETVDEMEKSASQLKKYCKNAYYSDSEVNKKCSSFKSLYEEVINSFVSDIDKYNKVLDNYNTYIKETGGTETLEKYSTKNKYIDFDGDKEFVGKE